MTDNSELWVIILLEKLEVVAITENVNWWKGRNEDGKYAIVPYEEFTGEDYEYVID